MAQLSTSVQNASLEIPSLLRTNSQVISLGTSAGTSATAVFVVDVVMVTNGGVDEWITIGIFNALTQLAANNLTGASQYGWVDIPGAKRVRVRRSDGTGGVGICDIEVCGAGR